MNIKITSWKSMNFYQDNYLNVLKVLKKISKFIGALFLYNIVYILELCSQHQILYLLSILLKSFINTRYLISTF